MVIVALLNVSVTLLTLVGALLNCYILLAVGKQAQTINRILLLHLGIVDVLLCLMSLTFSSQNFCGESNWVLCNIHGFLFTLLHPIALWTVCGLNYDRYYAITSPLHHAALVNPRKVAMVGLGIAWVLAIVLCLPPLFYVAPYYFRAELGSCMPHFSLGEGLSFWYSTTQTAFTIILPTALILCCNLKILMIAKNHQQRITAAVFELAISAQVTITNQKNFKVKSAVSTVLQLIGSFMLLYYPFYGIMLWESTTNTVNNRFLANNTQKREIEVCPILVKIASTLLRFSPFVNGLLYGIKDKILRKSFKNYTRKKISKYKLNQEIQERMRFQVRILNEKESEVYNGGKILKLRTHSYTNLKSFERTDERGSLVQRIIGVNIHLENDLKGDMSNTKLKWKLPKIVITRTPSEESVKLNFHKFTSNLNNFRKISTLYSKGRSRRKSPESTSDDDGMDYLRIPDFDDGFDSDQTRSVDLSDSFDNESFSMNETDNVHDGSGNLLEVTSYRSRSASQDSTMTSFTADSSFDNESFSE